MAEKNDSFGKWVRWKWAEGWGRWHVIAGTEPGAVAKLACGRVRKPPKERTDRPEDRLCPTCRTLDDLRLSYTKTTDDVPVKAGDLVGATS